jgi:CHAT domain-containing protein/Tfp pilus assembly protein PilF
MRDEVRSRTDSAGRKFVVKILPLQVFPYLPISRRAASALAGVAGLLWVSCGSVPPRAPAPGTPPAAASPTPAVKAEASILRVGVPVERSLSPGQPDEVPLDLEAGVYLRLAFDGRGTELEVSLWGPEGTVVIQEDGSAEGRLAWITATEGTYRLKVTAPLAKVSSRYRLLLLRRRPAIHLDDDHRLAADDALRAVRQEKDAAKAVQKAQMALKLWSDLQDEDGTFETLDSIKASDETNAVPWYEKALLQAQATANVAQQAKAQTDLGEALSRQGRLDEARSYLEAALPIWDRLGDSYQRSRSLYYLAFGKAKKGNYDEAVALYREALKTADPTWDITPDIWNAFGDLHSNRGENHDALNAFESALRFATEMDRKGGRAVALASLGNLHWRRGEPRMALEQLDEALNLNRSDPALQADAPKVQLLLGTVDLGLGRPREAIQNFQEALSAFRQRRDSSWISSALVSVGRANLMFNQPAEALSNFEEALQSAKVANDAKRTGIALQWIGVAQLQLRQVTRAIQSLKEALQVQVEVDHPAQALTEQKLGEAYQGQGDSVAAREALQRALQITEDVGAVYFRPSILLDLAHLDRQQEDFQAALRHIEEAIRILETVRSNLTDDRLRTSFFASRRSYYDLYVELLMELNQLHPDRGYADRAFGASQKGKARSLLDLLAKSRSELTRWISLELKREEEEVEARLTQIRQDLVAARSDVRKAGMISSLEKQLDEFGQRQVEIANRIKAEYPRYAQLRYPSPLQRQEIQRLLQPDEALLEYSLGEEKAYLFVVTTEGISSYTLKRSPAKIGEDVETLRASLEKGARPTNATRQASTRLYGDLIVPAVQSGLHGKGRLLIAPDGVLHHLAFEALAGAEGRFLIEGWAVSYIPSASILSPLSEPEPGGAPSKQFIAFAPIYGKSALQRQARGAGPEIPRGSTESAALPELEGAQEEVSAISSLYPDSERKLYVGSEASCKAFKEVGLRTHALHYAGHATLDEEHPEQSSLEFTDGKLRVDDIFNLELNADLVVLSACKTAGKVVTGEGLVGLTRAFLYAGTPSVVVTLWQAVDTSTRDLMVQFYRNLGRTGDKAEALRQAKLSLIQQGRKPYYWAPFILVGKPR